MPITTLPSDDVYVTFTLATDFRTETVVFQLPNILLLKYLVQFICIVNRYLQIAEQTLISAPSTRRNRQWLTLNLVWCTLAELTMGQNF